MVVWVKEAEAWVVVQEPYQLVDIRTVLENGLEKMKPFFFIWRDRYFAYV